MPSSDPLLPADLPKDDVSKLEVDAFVAKWKQGQAAEISNAQGFLIDLCGLLRVPIPDPTTKNPAEDGYVFERAVVFQDGATTSPGRIDLYKRGCFVLESKQGINEDRKRLGKTRSTGHGTRGSVAWERVIKTAKEKAARYARNLDTPNGNGLHSEPIPPLVIVCDVGYCFDIYANFGHPQRYSPFPDQRGYRIYISDLQRPEIRARLRLAFTDPSALDPSRRQAQVTRELAATLARLAANLEKEGHPPDAVFGFLTRCIFTMFAEDTDLLPSGSFTGLLREYEDRLDLLPDVLESLWAVMDAGGFSPELKARIRRFNGSLFQDNAALRLTSEQLDLLLDAAMADWTNVEPAIFGTLLERALDPRERHKLGAHYTPRAYVDRLVMQTVINPLREEWDAVQVAVARMEAEEEAASFSSNRLHQKRQRRARTEITDALRGFLLRLASIRVLDPACGSGNFLYVTLEHLKRLEAEVRQVLERYGENVLEMDQVAVTPAQFIGIEINPRAAAIADLVLWIGFLQWHLRTHGGPQALAEPIIHAYGNIQQRDAVLESDARSVRLDDLDKPITIWDGFTTKQSSTTNLAIPDADARVPVYDYENPSQATWPEAEFIIGNPPFSGSQMMREVLGDGYTEALRSAYSEIPESADLVMYWWHKAAQAVRNGHSGRFGFITTNTITQTYNRRVVEHHLNADPPLALAFAVPDHPWVDHTSGAAVRVAMTVGVRGPAEGLLANIKSEVRSDDQDARQVELTKTSGEIFSDLTVGVDITCVQSLRSNENLSFMGVKLVGEFVVTQDEARELGLGDVKGIERHLPRFRNGSDLTRKNRDVRVIDLFGLTEDEVRGRFPAVYQRVLDRVKPTRAENKRKSYREKWWVHAEPRTELRKAIRGLSRYIATSEVSKHRVFSFFEDDILPDGAVIAIATDDAYYLGVLSSRIHEIWTLSAGGTLVDGPRYTSTKTFRPFPFPAVSTENQEQIRSIAISLDDLRSSRLAEESELTLTSLYNVLSKVRDEEPLSEKESDVYRRGFVGILKEHHDELDLAVARSYGWDDLAPVFPEKEVLRRIVALNAARQAEEAAGVVRWLRPSFQSPDTSVQAKLDIHVTQIEVSVAPKKRESWPSTLPDRALAVSRKLQELAVPVSAETVASAFRRAPRRDVTDLLDTLVELGQARLTEDGAYTV